MSLQGIRVTWSAVRDGNEGVVTESRSDGTKTNFGPMPSHIVPAFIRGRQIIVQALLESQGYQTAKFDEELEPDFERYFAEPSHG